MEKKSEKNKNDNGSNEGVQVARITSKQLIITTLITAITSIIVTLISTGVFKNNPSEQTDFIDESGGSKTTNVTLGFSSKRNYLKYYIDISKEPFLKNNLLENCNSNDYLFYHSSLEYERVPTWENEKLYIVAITNPEKYAEWVQAENVIYREIIGVNDTDRIWLRNVVSEIRDEKDLTQRYNKLEKLLKVDFKIDGNDVPLESFNIEAFGFSLCYKNPNYKGSKKKCSYLFNCYTFQPKSLKEFSIIIPELTIFLDMKVDFKKANLEKANYFSAFTFGKNAYYPIINLDSENSILTVKSKERKVVIPGGGILLKWK